MTTDHSSSQNALVNSLWPIDAICHHITSSTLVRVMVCWPLSTNLLPKQIMTYHQRCSVAFTWGQFRKTCTWIQSITCARILQLVLFYLVNIIQCSAFKRLVISLIYLVVSFIMPTRLRICLVKLVITLLRHYDVFKHNKCNPKQTCCLQIKSVAHLYLAKNKRCLVHNGNVFSPSAWYVATW